MFLVWYFNPKLSICLPRCLTFVAPEAKRGVYDVTSMVSMSVCLSMYVCVYTPKNSRSTTGKKNYPWCPWGNIGGTMGNKRDYSIKCFARTLIV